MASLSIENKWRFDEKIFELNEKGSCKDFEELEKLFHGSQTALQMNSHWHVKSVLMDERRNIFNQY